MLSSIPPLQDDDQDVSCDAESYLQIFGCNK